MARGLVKRVSAIAAVLVMAAAICASASAADLVRTIKVDGVERTYRLHVPPGKPAQPMALVMVLHGGGGSGATTDKHTHFSAEADKQHFIVAYPDGSGRTRPFLNAVGRGEFLTWNAGDCCAYAMDHRVDDVAFLRAMVAAIARELPVDPRRVYAAGISNGGMMSYRLACEASDLVAAVGVVSGVVVTRPCAPASPVAVIHIHGSADQNVPLAGGVGPKARTRTNYPPVQSSIDLWAGADGCAAPAASEPAPGVTLRDYRGCRAGTEVAYYLIAGGGHAWPGGTQMASFLDKPSTAIAATPTIWEFFAAHPKQ
jgi:polyhydroxybutyrate depolymerase